MFIGIDENVFLLIWDQDRKAQDELFVTDWLRLVH